MKRRVFLVGKTDLEFILDGSGFGVAPEMGVFELDKVPELSLEQEKFETSIFNSSSLVGAATKRSVSNTLLRSVSLNTKPPVYCYSRCNLFRSSFLPF